MEHDFVTHVDHADDPGGQECRQVCRGGLAFCKKCKCAEGTLPSECPGEPVDEILQEAIYRNTIDYKDGIWYCPT